MNKIKLYILFILLYGNMGYSQDFQKDFGNVFTQLSQSDYCEIDAEVTIYSSRKNQTKIIELNTELKKYKNNFRTVLDNIETISNDDFLVLIDHEEKTVEIGNNQKLKKSDEKLLNEMNKVQAISKDTSVTILLLSNEKGIKTYEISNLKGSIQTMTIILNTNLNNIVKIEYDYNPKIDTEGHFVVINYTKFDYSKEISQNIFKATDVVQKKGKKFSLTPKYKTYNLINLYH